MDIYRSNPSIDSGTLKQAQQAQVAAQARHYGLKPEDIKVSADVSEESLRKFGEQFTSISKSESVPMDPGISARLNQMKEAPREATMQEFQDAMNVSTNTNIPLFKVFGDKNLEGGKFANIIPPYSNPEAQTKYKEQLDFLKSRGVGISKQQTTVVPSASKTPSGVPSVVPQTSSSTVSMINQTDDRARKEAGTSRPIVVNKGGDTVNNITNNSSAGGGAAGSPSREYNPWDNLTIGGAWAAY